MMSWISKLFFNLMYLKSPAWDTGISPPELEEFIETHAPGRALDIGCGTGTNAIRLAQAGWDVSGFDFSGRAISIARRKAKKIGLRVQFYKDDALRMQKIHGKFDLILDIGCFHSIRSARHKDYAQKIREHLSPSGVFMNYVFFRSPDSNPPGVLESELDKAFNSLERIHRENGENLNERKSAWLWYKLPDK